MQDKPLPFMPATAEDAPAEVYGPLDLNRLLIKRPAATFCMRLGEDIAIVDRAAKPGPGNLVVVPSGNGWGLSRITSVAPREIWGTVTYLIKARP